MSIATFPTSLRLLSQQKTWLEHYAASENRSLSGALSDLIDRAMKADPLKIVVRQCDLLGQQFFAVSVGVYGEDFHEGQDKDAAISAARAKAKELGLSIGAIEFRIENESGPAFGAAVPSLDEAA